MAKRVNGNTSVCCNPETSAFCSSLEPGIAAACAVNDWKPRSAIKSKPKKPKINTEPCKTMATPSIDMALTATFELELRIRINCKKAKATAANDVPTCNT